MFPLPTKPRRERTIRCVGLSQYGVVEFSVGVSVMVWQAGMNRRRMDEIVAYGAATLRAAAFVPFSVHDKCLFYASLHNKRLKIQFSIQRLPIS